MTIIQGDTLTERRDLELRAWLEHLQAELLDAAVYIERTLSDEALP